MHYCAYSFDDLFKAVYKRPATKQEVDNLAKMSQTERNKKIRAMSFKAGWKTSEVKTKEGLFVAFWPGS